MKHLTTYENPFKFSGKELDGITGLYDHGARSRNPVSTLWYGIDPLFEKYLDFSPYNYCAGNPVKLVDEDGKELDVCDGEESFTYNPEIGNNTYSGNNDVIKESVNSLNKMNSTKAGHDVLMDLHSSKMQFSITNGSNRVADRAGTKGVYDANGNLTGTILYANGFYSNFQTISHELFHSYQFLNGQGGASIFNEIEAYTFQSVVLSQYNDFVDWDLNRIEQEDSYGIDCMEALIKTEHGKCFVGAFDNLINRSFSEEDFFNAMILFRECSAANADGSYSEYHYPLKLATNKEYLIHRFKP